MRLLLHTHLLLWAGSPEGLPPAARELFDDAHSVPVFSSASLWEVAIKRGLGRRDFRVHPRVLRRGLLDNGYDELPITGEHAVALDGLPPPGECLRALRHFRRNTASPLPSRRNACSRARLGLTPCVSRYQRAVKI